MRLHRFFVKEPLENKEKVKVSDKELTHQWKNVFRLKPGNEVILLDNSSFQYFAVLTKLKKGEAELEIINAEKITDGSSIKLHLFPSLIKKERFEWVLEKGVELGVKSFTPVIAERSQVKSINLKRGEKIIKEAAEQSGKGLLPNLNPPKTLEEVSDEARKSDLKLVALDASGEIFDQSLLKDNLEEIGILVGPEGGWSEKERDFLQKQRIPIFSLGDQTLRAETATIAASSLVLLN